VKMVDLYEVAGVDVEAGDTASSIAAKFCKETYQNSPIASVVDMTNGNFRGPRAIDLDDKFRMKPYYLSCAPDGIGTKVVLHDAAKTYGVAAFDLIAMTSFDLVRWGGMPVFFTSVLDVSKLGKPDSDSFKATVALYSGAAKAATEVDMVILNGETAELGAQVASENPDGTLQFNWGGSAQGLYHPDKMILGKTLKPGQVIMLLKENGFRSNGISLVRSIFAHQYGKDWYTKPDAQKYIRMAAEPSVLYDKFFCSINGWYEDDSQRIKVHSLVHLSGGSFESKFGKDILYPLGLSADISDPWELPEIMQECSEWGTSDGKIDDLTLYRTWNGGQGALAVIDKIDAEKFMEEATRFGLEAKIGGVITKNDTPSVRLKSSLTGDDIIFG